MPFPKQQISHSSKLKEFADDNLKFDGRGRKFSKRVENTVGKGNCSLRAISPFPTVFSKDVYSKHVKTWGLLGKGQYKVDYMDFLSCAVLYGIANHYDNTTLYLTITSFNDLEKEVV